MIFDWEDKYSIGVEEIDAQHQKLFMMVKVLHGYIETGKSHMIMKNFINELVKYTKTHFEFEENLIKENGLPSDFYDAEVREHEDLMEQVTKLQREFEVKETVFRPKMVQFLVEWLKNHIIRMDSKIGGILQK